MEASWKHEGSVEEASRKAALLHITETRLMFSLSFTFEALRTESPHVSSLRHEELLHVWLRSVTARNSSVFRCRIQQSTPLDITVCVSLTHRHREPDSFPTGKLEMTQRSIEKGRGLCEKLKSLLRSESQLSQTAVIH